MGRNKEEQARREGMAYALRIAKEKGIEELERDLKLRGATNIPIGVSMKACNEAIEKIKFNTCDTMLALSCLVMHDEFDFGQKRLNRFIEHFINSADSLAKDYTNWDDTLQILKDECGIDLSIRGFNENVKC